MGFRSFVAATALLAAFSAPAIAAPPEQTERLIYMMQFGGLAIADVMITLTETPGHYQTGIQLRSRGLMAMFRNFSAQLAGEGALVDNGLRAEPISFRRDWSITDLSSDLEIAYDPATHLATAHEHLFDPISGQDKTSEAAPWNKRREVLKPVPAPLRTKALDPLAAFISAREMIRSNPGPATFKVPVFDGLRRYDIVVKTEAARDITVNDETRKLIAAKGQLEPVFGFDDNLQDRVHEGDGKILFTADARLIPVQIMVGNGLGVGVMNLTTDCRVDPRPCDDFGQEQALAPHN